MILGFTNPDTPDSAKFVLPAKARQLTHTHVIGGTRKGKSKLIEHMVREDMRPGGPGLCVIDWHGTLYRELLEWMAYVLPEREVVLLNPSQPEFVTGFNPFSGSGPDVSTQVGRRVTATVKPWGLRNTNELPTFERVCRGLYTFAVEAREPLHHAELLLRYPKKEVREYALTVIQEDQAKELWRELQHVHSLREWRELTLSTANRLGRFLGSKGIRRFMGREDGNLDVREAMDSGKVVLVNLAESDFLDREAARVFASLLLNEFFEAAMRRANAGKRELFVLYLDEFHEYMTSDLAAILDQSLKGGLHAVLAHQHLGQLRQHEDPHLKDSILTNARIRMAFGGLAYPSAREMAEELFLKNINEREIKQRYFRTTTVDHEVVEFWDEREGSSESDTRHHWGDHSTHTGTSMTSGTQRLLKPVLGKEEIPPPEWSREEKVSRWAEALIAQKQKRCVVRIDREPPEFLKVREVETYPLEPEMVACYERRLYEKQGALPASEVDRILEDRAKEFIQKARKVAEEERLSSKKKR